MSRDTAFTQAATALGYRFDGEIKLGGNYAPLGRDVHQVYVGGRVSLTAGRLMV